MAGKPIGTRATWYSPGGNFKPALAVLIEARRNGLAFGAAWPTALEACDPDDRTTLHETASAWRAEYERRNSYGGNLVAALAAMLDHDASHRHDCRLVA
jgi:hypothetical protein